MKINYPIKYVPIPVRELGDGSWQLNDSEEQSVIVCYLVTTCYVLTDSTKYQWDGSSVKEYEVVFSYQIANNIGNKNSQASVGVYETDIYPTKIEMVFDTYEEALKVAELKNRTLYKDSYSSLPCTPDVEEDIHTAKGKFAEKLLYYKSLEQQLLEEITYVEYGEHEKLKEDIIDKKKDPMYGVVLGMGTELKQSTMPKIEEEVWDVPETGHRPHLLSKIHIRKMEDLPF